MRGLQRRLPDYMVPSAMIALDALPLTAHGKVDRDALPEPDFSAEAIGRAPRNAAETILCDVLAEVHAADDAAATAAVAEVLAAYELGDEPPVPRRIVLETIG